MSPSEQQNTVIVDNFVADACNEFVEILHQDDDILLINKPSGLFSLSGKNPENWDSVHFRLVHGQESHTPAFPNAILPHRLDLGASGIMVVGLNAMAGKHLNKQFQTRSIQKRYMAMLEGWVSNDEGEITAPIAKDNALFPCVKICQETGKAATSGYKVLQRFDNPRRTLVQFTPITGRTHQLRIHSKTFGHPILGCDLYKSEHSEQLAERLQLHASELFFTHPTSGQQIHATCPCPFAHG
ncbi:RluA family pseudouridine synthase [Enterovibrio sp. ZSDZ35]|uniref:RluA family pseudouridine synthase n=1 Tax=Enterovibrio qingdaonensis TaxID=2899818 RepID=A0ABT5QPZ6_9GAMM|nr:RluA family pseudouridine synthase [Enterovibrio sp. ZSDZ35]MDD1783057.1 RluA family pseudouridine synthase [Enterovibrio sp. ZSDZ35]